MENQPINKTPSPESKKQHDAHKKPEEEKTGRSGYKHKPKSNPYYKERFEVTLETVIPDLPKKNEMHSKPDDEAFQNDIDKIQNQIDELYRKMTDITREAKNKSYLPADKTLEDLISLFKVKLDEKRRAHDEFQAVQTERDVLKKQVDEYYERGNELRFKMRIPGKKTELEARLKELRDQQSKGIITLQEEKQLIREIAELEKSLPFAGPLEELDSQSKEVREQLKTVKARLNQKFETFRLLKEECKDIQDKIDKTREEFEKKKEDHTPAIEKMKEEYREKINTLKKKKKDMFEHQAEAWRKYEDQQFEIEKIKIMKRKKEKLLREEKRRQQDEERRKQREVEEQENKDIPYREQIELCDLLIRYCQRVNPTGDETSTTISQKDKSVVIEEAMQSAEWKNAKGTYILSKKEQVDDFFSGRKKERRRLHPAKQHEEPTSQGLNHQIETLTYFEEIKVTPPLFVEKISETVRVLQEKKAYYEKMSAEAIELEESRKNLSEEERKRLEEEDKLKKLELQNAKVREERRAPIKPKFDLESELDFPRM